jgi:predicted transcriptional regulator
MLLYAPEEITFASRVANLKIMDDDYDPYQLIVDITATARSQQQLLQRILTHVNHQDAAIQQIQEQLATMEMVLSTLGEQLDIE